MSMAIVVELLLLTKVMEVRGAGQSRHSSIRQEILRIVLKSYIACSCDMRHLAGRLYFDYLRMGFMGTVEMMVKKIVWKVQTNGRF